MILFIYKGDKMKKLIWLIIIVVIGIVVYNHFIAPLSEEEQKVKVLEGEFNSAIKDFHQAERSAGISGMDSTADLDDAIDKVKLVKEKLEELKEKLTSESARERADKLKRSINKFSEGIGGL